MEIVIVPAEQIGDLVATAITRLVDAKPDAVLGLATGSSPLSTYAALARRFRAGEVSFAKAQGFLLDEYVGLAADHPERYRAVVERELEQLVDFADGAVQGPDGLAADLPAACLDYEGRITAAGGVDLQLLGIGTDGHIGFNEPGSSLASRTRIKTLTPQTREDNARFFASAEEVPHHVVTQGLGTISAARHLVLVATGASKAAAVHAMAEGPVSAFCPASVLQLHPHVTVLVDDSAAGDLALADYYHHTYARKPTWQRL